MDKLTAKICANCGWIYSQPFCPKCHEKDHVTVMDLLIYKYQNEMKDEVTCPSAIK